jgi:hypothetical protein
MLLGGKGGDVVGAPVIHLTDFQTYPSTVWTAFSLDADGNWYYREGFSGDPTTLGGAWLIPGANSNLYDSRVTITGGSAGAFTSGLNNTWQAQGTDRIWKLNDNVPSGGLADLLFTIEIRLNAGAVLKSTTLDNLMEIESII